MANTATFNPVSIGIDAGMAALNWLGQSYQNKKNRQFAQQEAEKQRQWNEKMYNEQNAWNMEMWNKTNEYNDPSHQVARLREAGLNPLYYGLDGTSANGMQSAQPLGYERADVGNQVNPLSVGLDAAVKSAQLQNIEAQTQKTKSETKAIDAKLPFEVEELKNQVRNSKLTADAQETVNKYIDRQQEAEIRMKNATADEADAACEKAYAEIEKMDYEKTTMFMGWLETHEKILTLQKNRELTDKQMDELESLIRVNNATASKIGLDVSNYDDITVIGTASHTMKLGPSYGEFSVDLPYELLLFFFLPLPSASRSSRCFSAAFFIPRVIG